MAQPQYRIDAVSAVLSSLCDSPHCEPPAHDDDAREVLAALTAADQAEYARVMDKIIEPFTKFVGSFSKFLSEHPEAEEYLEQIKRERADEPVPSG